MKFLHFFVVLNLALPLLACTSSRPVLPESQADYAQVPGGSIARFWGDDLPEDFSERMELSLRQFAESEDSSTFLDKPTFLAISGGGANGAFGAGLLKGWSESGTRPEAYLVSGVSIGALIAPFAFLGSDYDAKLERLFTNISTDDVVARRTFLRSIGSDAIYDTRRLSDLLRKTIDREMISAIAREFDRGRRLMIGTTNLEAGRPVTWNIGAIAKVGSEEADQLIRDVMLASASIPGVFPPVRIKVRVGNQVYEEFHVDGGVSNQVFLFPIQWDLRDIAHGLGVVEKQQIYIIRNGYLDARWTQADPNIVSILGLSLATLIRTQGLGDLYRLYLGALRDQSSFNLAYIPKDFDYPSEELFDPDYMRALFWRGYELAQDGYEWSESPPGFEQYNP